MKTAVDHRCFKGGLPSLIIIKGYATVSCEINIVAGKKKDAELTCRILSGGEVLRWLI